MSTIMKRMTDADGVLAATDLLAVEEEVVEVPLLLSGGQVSALEWMAHRSGLTTGAMLRQLLRDFLAGQRVVSSVPCKVEPI